LLRSLLPTCQLSNLFLLDFCRSCCFSNKICWHEFVYFMECWNIILQIMMTDFFYLPSSCGVETWPVHPQKDGAHHRKQVRGVTRFLSKKINWFLLTLFQFCKRWSPTLSFQTILSSLKYKTVRALKSLEVLVFCLKQIRKADFKTLNI